MIFFFFFLFLIQITPHMQLSCDRRPWQGYPTAPGTRQQPYTLTNETKRNKRSHETRRPKGDPPKLANRPTQPNLPDTNMKLRLLRTQAPQALRPGGCHNTVISPEGRVPRGRPKPYVSKTLPNRTCRTQATQENPFPHENTPS